MDIDFDLEVRAGYLCLVCAGIVTAESFIGLIAKGLSAAQEHGVTAILIDCRKLDATALTTFDRFILGERGAELQRKSPTTCYVAAVAPPPIADSRKLGETVAVNRGFLGRVFFDMDEALAEIGERLDRKRC
ncbi:hypothetical protein [Kistimonas asteriae]|uniref:hypothetical protein n=1 Tax=Kistimonas asteriae TaxID=517724 RepID=UPI001BA81CED|nr:hypothetical protein [Kistimonas asteriae]